jgi:hypothetical protein
MRDIGGWAKAWFSDPFSFAVSFLAAAAQHDGAKTTPETTADNIEAG